MKIYNYIDFSFQFSHMSNQRSRCYQLDMIPTTAQFFEKIFDDNIKSAKSDLLNYQLNKMKSRINGNRTFYFENEITYELIDTFTRHFNHNDRSWWDCYEVIFWLLQAYNYKILFNDQNKKLIEDFFDPLEKDLIRFHPQNISNDEIKIAMQGMTIVNLNETATTDAHSTSNNFNFSCLIV